MYSLCTSLGNLCSRRDIYFRWWHTLSTFYFVLFYLSILLFVFCFLLSILPLLVWYSTITVPLCERWWLIWPCCCSCLPFIELFSHSLPHPPFIYSLRIFTFIQRPLPAEMICFFTFHSSIDVVLAGAHLVSRRFRKGFIYYSKYSL